ncbi:hypothetical protein QQF64_032904 [Cirrhinus molitorella]|uniref:STAT transcription factor all-alpha domain-containing protein n=1 Tax=Cirrhinus molitorella TaxID=172907 RepID=A0ABR3MSD7_9TELE
MDHKVNTLKKSVQVMMKEIANALTLVEQIQLTLISEELPEWKKRQQMACIGGPRNTCLEPGRRQASTDRGAFKF